MKNFLEFKFFQLKIFKLQENKIFSFCSFTKYLFIFKLFDIKNGKLQKILILKSQFFSI